MKSLLIKCDILPFLPAIRCTNDSCTPDRRVDPFAWASKCSLSKFTGKKHIFLSQLKKSCMLMHLCVESGIGKKRKVIIAISGKMYARMNISPNGFTLCLLVNCNYSSPVLCFYHSCRLTRYSVQASVLLQTAKAQLQVLASFNGWTMKMRISNDHSVALWLSTVKTRICPPVDFFSLWIVAFAHESSCKCNCTSFCCTTVVFNWQLKSSLYFSLSDDCKLLLVNFKRRKQLVWQL